MSNLIHEILFLVLVVASILIIAKTENTNGKIEQCNDIGWKFVKDIGCIDNETYIFKYGHNNIFNKQNITLKFDPNLLSGIK